MIIELIKEFGSASKKDIDDLILDKLSDVLDDKKKKTKVKNMIYGMSKRKKLIKNEGSKRHPKWVLS